MVKGRLDHASLPLAGGAPQASQAAHGSSQSCMVHAQRLLHLRAPVSGLTIERALAAASAVHRVAELAGTGSQ